MNVTGDPVPLVDQEVLDRLRSSMEDLDDYWVVFTQNYIDLLPQRIELIRQTLTTGDSAGALAAVLSLKTSSQMIGALRIAATALELELRIREQTRNGDAAVVLPRLAATYLQTLKRYAIGTADRLRDALEE